MRSVERHFGVCDVVQLKTNVNIYYRISTEYGVGSLGDEVWSYGQRRLLMRVKFVPRLVTLKIRE
jgi:hypothetical protein